jgi:hypothetical protein
MAWVESTDCSGAPQCVHQASITFASPSIYGYAETVVASDGNPNNTSCDPLNPNCPPGITCVDLGGGNGVCSGLIPFTVRAEAGPCLPNALYIEGGRVD